MKIEELVTEILAFKLEYPALSIDQVLKVFEIKTMKEQTLEMRRRR